MRREHTTFVLLAARLDIVGMGCHAGLNSVQVDTRIASVYPPTHAHLHVCMRADIAYF